MHEVESDTVLVYQAAGWNKPSRLVFIDIMIVYMGLIFVGILMLIYGQFMLAWESNYFDFLLSRKIDFSKYFLAKYILLIVFGILMFLITTPIVFISKELLYINAILTVYCLGVNSIVLFIVAGFTRKRLDLNASIFSTQGKGANQFTLIIPTMIIPLLIFVLFVIFNHRIEGYLFLLVLGVLGLIFYRPLLKFCLHFFYQQKYKISSGFRQNRG